jgi:hypothetical protein
VEEELRRIEQALECIRDGGAITTEDLANIETGLSGLEERVTTTEEGISGLDTRVGTNETDISGLDSRVGTNETDISGLDSRVGTNETDISNLVDWVVLLLTDVGGLGGTVRSGSGTPASGTGANGDYYHDTSTDDIYGPKAAGAWPGTPLDLGGGDDLPLYQSVWCPVDSWSVDPGPAGPGDTDFDNPLGESNPAGIGDRPAVFRTGGLGNYLFSRSFVFRDNRNDVAGMYIPCPDRYTGGPVNLKLIWVPADSSIVSLGDTAHFTFRGALLQPDTLCSINSFTMGATVQPVYSIANSADAVQAADITITPNNQGITYVQNNGALLYVFVTLFGTSSQHQVGDCGFFGLWAQFPLDTDEVTAW